MRLLAAIVAILTLPSSGMAASATAPSAAASTPHPLATRVALDTLRSGGNAIDAAVAAAFTLAVADPSSASLGGGGLMLWFDASTQTVWALDFREIAPRELPRSDQRGATVAVPGLVHGLAAAHSRFGTAPWSGLLASAILLARENPTLSPALAMRFRQHETRVAGVPLVGGDSTASPEVRLDTSRLAETLQQIARNPTSPFRASEGRRLASFLRDEGSGITLLDLESYEPVWRAPLMIERRGVELYAFPPPSGGGITLIHLSAQRAPVHTEPAGGSDWIAALRSASRERLLRMGDPERTRFDLSVPVRESELPEDAPDETSGGGGLAVVDASGNAVALVLTTGSTFGSGLLAPGGFLLNDALRDFDSEATRGPNAPEPNRRPATSMTPLIATRDGRAIVTAAAGGGAPASSALAQFTLAVLDGRSPAEELDRGRYHHDGVPDQLVLEGGRTPAGIIDTLTGRRQAVRIVPSAAEVHAVIRSGSELMALADPRGGGAPGGY